MNGYGHQEQLWRLVWFQTGFIKAYGAGDLAEMTRSRKYMNETMIAMEHSVKIGLDEHVRQEMLGEQPKEG